VKSKKYVVPLAVLNPELTAGFIVAYLTDGRFKAPKDAAVEIVPGDPVTDTSVAVPVRVEPGTRRPLTSADVAPAIAPVPVVAPTTVPGTPQ
jgi:hypothetical protein